MATVNSVNYCVVEGLNVIDILICMHDRGILQYLLENLRKVFTTDW